MIGNKVVVMLVIEVEKKVGGMLLIVGIFGSVVFCCKRCVFFLGVMVSSVYCSMLVVFE